MGRGRSWERHDDVQLVNLRNQGYDANMIAAVVDRSPKAVKQRLSKLSKKYRVNGYDNTKKPDPEEVRYKIWGTRLTDELRELYHAGVSLSQMILRYDDGERVSRTAIEARVKAMRNSGELPRHRQNRNIANALRRNSLKVKAWKVLDPVFPNTEE